MSIWRKAANVCAPAVVTAGVLVGASQGVLAQSTEVSSNLIPPSFESFGKTLADSGIYLSTSYVGNLQANVSGGRTTGTIFAGELTIGATLDLQKMAGLTGGSLHIILDERSGHSASELAGTNFGMTANHGPNDVIRLSELYYQQAIDHDRLDLIFGRTNPTLDFATSAISCSFVSNLFCAQPGIWYSVNSDLPFPLSEWGGRANFQITPDVYLRAGLYQTGGAFTLSQVLGQGFNWRWDQSHGLYVPIELGYQTKTSKFDVGGYLDGGSKSNAIYVQGQQVVWASKPTSVTAFAGAMVVGGNAEPYWGEYYGGLFITGPLASRPADTLGFAGAYMPLNHSLSPYKSEVLFEAYYGITVMPGVVFKPDLQYMIHPDEIGYFGVTTTRHFNNAFVVGAQLYVDLGEILKFPHFVAHD